jgi:hypothetical protein
VIEDQPLDLDLLRTLATHHDMVFVLLPRAEE